MTLPHCTGCTEPGEPTHQQETVWHIHDPCKRAYKFALEVNSELRAENDVLSALTDMGPDAAAKLLAERDAGRALYEALRQDMGMGWGLKEALEAYRKVVD